MPDLSRYKTKIQFVHSLKKIGLIMKYRNALGALSAAALMVFSLTVAASSDGDWYGSHAIGAEAAGFDALAVEVFGAAATARPDTRLADSSPWYASAQGVIVK